MPTYRYEIHVALPDNEAALDYFERFHAVVCNKKETIGQPDHACEADWHGTVAGFFPVFPKPPEPVLADFVEDFNE